MRSIPIAKPIIYEEEIKAVEEVLRAGMLAQGEAVIPAAGLGTRFLPVTKSMPKEMLPIIGKPIIQFVVEEAIASGIEDIIIITGRGKSGITAKF